MNKTVCSIVGKLPMPCHRNESLKLELNSALI